MSALPVEGLAEPVEPLAGQRSFDLQGAVVIFAAGTGNPYVTTDTAAVIRALSVERRGGPQSFQGPWPF
jgi:uridylate kinase